MIIQMVLILSLLLLLLVFLQDRNATRLRAWMKLLFLAFVVFSVAAILWPQLLTDIAHFVGVGRGADLLLYGLAVSFVFVVLGVYLKFKDLEHRYVKLARHIALTEAEVRENK